MNRNSDDQPNWLERLGDKIPGYSGYTAREERRDIDRLHREHLADRLRAAKTPLTDLVRDLSSHGRLFEVGPIDRLLKKLDRIENRVRFAAYGYAGFFDLVKIDEIELQSVYRFDLALVERVDRIEAQSRGLKSASNVAEQNLQGAASELEQEIDDFDQIFDERFRSIESFGPDATPGRPTFGT